MAQPLEESLLQAVKTDDIKAFVALRGKNSLGAYRLGRFPVLSLLYLYNSKKILSSYEERFLRISDYTELPEPVEISEKFSEKAGKCLRLYFDEAVTPLEMLLILNKTAKLKQVYPWTKPSQKVKDRLKAIYSIRYSLEVRFVGDGIELDRRPLSYREKKKLTTVILCLILAVTIAVGAPVTAVALIPKPIEGEVTKPTEITAPTQMDFTSDKEYVLKDDIVLSENYSVEKFNCKIKGEGHKLVLGKGATLGELGGSISDLTIESQGAAFTTVSEKGSIQNVTFTVTADTVSGNATALVADRNYGTIDGVTVNASGKMTAAAPEEQTTSDVTYGGIVAYNDAKLDPVTQRIYRGTVKNCTVNYSRLELKGETQANASFGGVAGTNNGYLRDCTVTGEIVADTFDIAGVSSVNNGMLTGSVNEANLSQTSSDINWNPICCGIVMSNTYAVENCRNSGKITSVSNCGQVEEQEGYESTATAAGIAYLNRSSSSAPYIQNCTNEGSVECSAEYRIAYAAGVCISSSGDIVNCKNSGSVSSAAGNGCETYAGGITARAYGDVSECVNVGAVTVKGSGAAYAGGISAFACSQIYYCLSGGDVSAEAETVYAGGIFGYGEVTSYGRYVYWGVADHCISQGNIKVTPTGETPTYAGGIVGFVREENFDNAGSTVYYGGRVINCYFTGEYKSDASRFGNIVGVCGANIYQSNSYQDINGNGYHNFEGNFYKENSFTAFGATVSEEKEFLSVADKGASSLPLEDIENSEGYQAILTALEN